jgi:transposase
MDVILGECASVSAPRGSAEWEGGSRKIMIVALARKLLVALWRYVKDGVIPDGAKMKAA